MHLFVQFFLQIVDSIQALNYRLFFWMHSTTGESVFFDTLVRVVAEDIDQFILFTLFGVLFMRIIRDHIPRMRFDRWIDDHSFMRIAVSVGIALISSYILKVIFKAPRPYVVFQEIEPLFLAHDAFASFISGHTATFFALAMAVYFRHKIVGIGFACIASGIALSRIIAGVHFPVDIFAGAFVGVLISICVRLYFQEARKEFYIKNPKSRN